MKKKGVSFFGERDNRDDDEDEDIEEISGVSSNHPRKIEAKQIAKGRSPARVPPKQGAWATPGGRGRVANKDDDDDDDDESDDDESDGNQGDDDASQDEQRMPGRPHPALNRFNRRSSIKVLERGLTRAISVTRKSGLAKFIQEDDTHPDVYDSGVNAMALICALVMTVPYQLLASLNTQYLDFLQGQFAACPNGVAFGYTYHMAFMSFR
jgi:hypothetical protein